MVVGLYIKLPLSRDEKYEIRKENVFFQPFFSPLHLLVPKLNLEYSKVVISSKVVWATNLKMLFLQKNIPNVLYGFLFHNKSKDVIPKAVWANFGSITFCRGRNKKIIAGAGPGIASGTEIEINVHIKVSNYVELWPKSKSKVARIWNLSLPLTT